MRKLNFWTVFLGVLVIALAGGSYFVSHSNPTLENTKPTANLVSYWDTPRESYSGNNQMTVYRSPSCGCCGLWIEHIKKHGFEVTDIQTEEVDKIKQENHIASDLASCHTAIIDGYVMEGHIPADDIKRFLKQKPNVWGLTVPGMPLGTPGMEAGERKQPFEVLALQKDGNIEVFQQYENY